MLRRSAGAGVLVVGMTVLIAAGAPAGASAHSGWKVAKVPSAAGPVFTVSCPTKKQCWAGASDLLHSSNGGKSWSKQKSAGNDIVQIEQVSCPTSKVCWAIGVTNGESVGQSMLFHTTNAGKTWTAHPGPSGVSFASALACVDKTSCWVGGGNASIAATSDAGKTWQTAALPSSDAVVNSIACMSGTECLAAGMAGTKDEVWRMHVSGGLAEWSAQALPVAHGDLRGISCAGTTTCVAVGSTPNQKGPLIMRTRDAGKKWHKAPAPKGPTTITGVSCPTASHCFLVGTNNSFDGYIAASKDSGKKWKVQAHYNKGSAAGHSLAAIACATPKACSAVGASPGSGPFAVSTRDGG
jgi:photosystem II stability/assembly factor-like uncharacterized protein